MKKETLRRFKKGDDLSARRFNKQVDRLNDLTAIIPATQSLTRSPVPVMVKVVTEYADQILCEQIDGSRLLVDKPWTLRATIFDGKEYDDKEYEYSAINERTATEGEDSEDQEIAPPYLVDDMLLISPYVGFRPSGSSGFIDLNNDSRVFLGLCEEEE